jgi:hypothetical protein
MRAREIRLIRFGFDGSLDGGGRFTGTRRRGFGSRGGIGSGGLRGGRIQPVLQQISDIALDQFQLIQAQVGIGNGKDVAGLGLFVNENAVAIADELLLDLQDSFAFEHDGQDITGGRVLRIVLLDELAQEGLGGLFLDGVGDRRRGLVNALPMGNEPAATLGIGEFILPAGGADVGAAEFGFFVDQQGVIRFFVGERLAADFTAVAARLYVPLGNQALPA